MGLNEQKIEKKKKKKTWLFLGLVFLLPLWIVWSNIFPTKHYFFNKITGNGLRMTEKKIDGKRYILAPLENDILIDELEIEALFDQEATEKKVPAKEKKLSLAKNYEVSLYPWGEEIVKEEKLKEILFSNDAGFPGGTLLADEKAVYVVSGGQLRPFLSPEVFERLGYQWEKIIADRSLPNLLVGETLNLQASHPDGAIFKEADGKFFIFFQGQKRLVSENLLKAVWPDFFWIEIGVSEPVYFNACPAKEAFFFKRTKFDCQFDLSQRKETSNILVIAPEGLDGQKVEAFQLTTRTSVFLNSKRNLSLFLKKTKSRLAVRYGFLKKL